MAEKKRIVILMSDAGFGHRSAAQAITAALGELYGEACAVEVLNPLSDKRVPPILRNTETGYDKLVTQMPDLYSRTYEMSNAPLPTAVAGDVLAAGLFDAIHHIVQAYQPDAFVVVHPDFLAPLAAVCEFEGRHIPMATVVTDLVTVHRLWFNTTSDLCLVPTEEVQDLALRAGLAADRVKITGIPVNPGFARATREPPAIRAALGWQPDLTTLLVAGSKRTQDLPDVLRVLNHSGLPIQLAVVAGGDEKLYCRLQGIEWHRVAHVYSFVDDMPTLMRAADCVLSKAGGLIVSEALACGRPLMLTNVIEGQETGNAQYVVAGGAGELAGDPAAALEVLCHWLDQGGRLLRERSANARRLGRPRAAYDVAQAAWELAQKGPTQLRSGRRISPPEPSADAESGEQP